MSSREQLLQSITSPGPTNPFAVSFLQLCQISYLPIGDIVTAVGNMPPLDGGGYWECGWGPETDTYQANLAFVANYYMTRGLPPVFTTVVLRGTDFYVQDGWGIVEQIWEDLDVTSQVPMPWAPTSPARIANGTLDGLTRIQNLRSGGKSMLDYLVGFLSDPANNKPLLITTGHSLGGCLTSVVAPWLNAALAQRGVNVPQVPCSFAGPTAGNAAFAAYFQSTFNYSLRYYNTLDVAPFAWANLSGIATIYDGNGLPAPDSAYLAILGFEAAMWRAGVSYAQPLPISPLTGEFASELSWQDELFLQHHTTTYMALLGGTSVTTTPVQKSVVPSRIATHVLRQRLGPLADVVAAIHTR